MFAAIGLFGATIIIPLGCFYVAIVAVLRNLLTPKEGLPTTP